MPRTPHALEPLEPRRHLSAGDLDPSFGVGGTVTLRNGVVPKGRAPSVQPTAVTLDHAGRAVVVSVVSTAKADEGGNRASATVLTRVTADGRPDTRFAIPTGGSIVLDEDVRPEKVVVDSHNRIYVFSGSSYENVGRIFRYTESGKLDRTYGTYEAGSFGIGPIFDVTMGDDDVLWAFTAVYDTEGPDGPTAYISRVAPDGKATRSVDVSPLYQAPVTAGNYQYDEYSPGVIRTLPDGSVLAVGTSDYTVYGTDDSPNTDEIAAVAMKFTPGGKPDRTYGTRGRAVFRRVEHFSTANGFGGVNVSPVGIASDGTVVLRDTPPGDTTDGGTPRTVLLTPAGRYGGVAAFGPTVLERAYLAEPEFLTQPDGRRLVLDPATKTLRRFNANGTRDTTFNHGSPFTGVTAIAFGPDNTLFTVDTGRSASDSRFVVRRIEL